MLNDLATDLSHERYVVDVDGIAKAEYPIFVNALKVSLQLRQRRPNSRVKPREPRRRNRSLNLLCSHSVGHDRAARP